MTQYVLGVDGGTTKTIALVADDQGHILGAGRGGNSNWVGTQVDVPMGVVAEAVRQALSQAGLEAEQIEVGVFTLAGADWPEDHVARRQALEKAGIARRVIVKNDSFGGLRAGTHAPYGTVIAAGTGFNAAVITPDGQEWAYGYYETGGGGGDISRAAIEAVLRAEDGRGQPTRLTELVLGALGYPTPEALLRDLVEHKLDWRRTHTLAPLVFEAAVDGDEVAVGILTREGRAEAEYITAIARRFNLCDLEFDVVLAGSVFKGKGTLLIDTITREIHEVAPRAHIVRARFEPAVGSVLLAYDALGLPVTEAMYHNLEQTVPDRAFFKTAELG